MRFRLLSKLALVAALMIGVLAVYVTVQHQTTDPNLLCALIIVGLFALVEPITIIWDKFGPTKPSKPAKPVQRSDEDYEEDYFDGQFRSFSEKTRFVPLAVDAIVQTEISSRDRREFRDIEDAIRACGERFVLVGDPGAGKTTLLKKLMLDKIEQYRVDKRNNRLPVWINLGLNASPVEISELLKYWWDNQLFLPDTPEKYLKQHNLALFLDGLNEMPLDSRELRAKTLRAFIEANESLPVIVTCRTRDYEDDEGLNLGLPVLYVKDLDDARIQAFVRARRADSLLWDDIRSDNALYQMARNPYKLAMLIEVYELSRQSMQPLPRSIDELYRTYLVQTYNRYTSQRTRNFVHPLTKIVGLSMHVIERRLEHLAYLMIVQNRGTSASYFWAKRKVGYKVLKSGFDMGVLIKKGDDIEFFHQSLQGYFAIKPLGQALTQINAIERLTKNPVGLIRQISDLGENASPAVPGLSRAVKHNDYQVRLTAIIALVHIQERWWDKESKRGRL